VCRTAGRLRHVRADCRQTGPPPGSRHRRDGPEQPRVDGYRWDGGVKYSHVNCNSSFQLEEWLRAPLAHVT